MSKSEKTAFEYATSIYNGLDIKINLDEIYPAVVNYTNKTINYAGEASVDKYAYFNTFINADLNLIKLLPSAYTSIMHELVALTHEDMIPLLQLLEDKSTSLMGIILLYRYSSLIFSPDRKFFSDVFRILKDSKYHSIILSGLYNPDPLLKPYYEKLDMAYIEAGGNPKVLGKYKELSLRIPRNLKNTLNNSSIVSNTVYGLEVGPVLPYLTDLISVLLEDKRKEEVIHVIKYYNSSNDEISVSSGLLGESVSYIFTKRDSLTKIGNVHLDLDNLRQNFKKIYADIRAKLNKIVDNYDSYIRPIIDDIVLHDYTIKLKMPKHLYDVDIIYG